MKIQISRNEMRILGHLHEHAQGFDDRFRFKPEDVATAIGISDEQLRRDTSFLSEHGLVQLKLVNLSNNDFIDHRLVGLNLTGDGENLIRNLEAEMEDELLKAPDYSQTIGAKITVKSAEFIWDTAKAVLVLKLSQWLTGQP